MVTTLKRASLIALGIGLAGVAGIILIGARADRTA